MAKFMQIYANLEIFLYAVPNEEDISILVKLKYFNVDRTFGTFVSQSL